MKVDSKHSKRIHDELVSVGMTRYGLLKRESAHLPKIIHKDEHIHGVVYGITDRDSAMIVATDKRILNLDYKILFHKTEELTYDVISGVSHNFQGKFAGIVLHTRLGDYQLRFVNTECAKKFVEYVESRKIETQHPQQISKLQQPTPTKPKRNYVAKSLNQEEKNFLVSHEIATLSTVSEEGKPHGATVYYACDKNNFIYIVTKDQTTKAKDIGRYPYIALTITDANLMQTMQLEGVAHIETDVGITKNIYDTILRPRFLEGHAQLAPIIHLPLGEYEVIVIEPTYCRLTNYKTIS